MNQDESNLILQATHFASMAHTGQKRKYTGEPYINHPLAVAGIIASSSALYGDDPVVRSGALLHDVLEDTAATFDELTKWFGLRTAQLVDEVTDKSEKWMGNRAARKAIDRAHIAKASPAGKTIKLADLIDNTRTIVQYDPDFARVYLKEKEELLGVLTQGDHTLWRMANDRVVRAKAELSL